MVRVYDVSGNSGEVTLSFAKELEAAFVTDTNEKILSQLPTFGNAVKLTVPACSVVTVKCIFK